MVSIIELNDLILSFDKNEMTSIEVLSKAKESGMITNSNFWNSLKNLEKYGSIKIDDDRKPWMIRRIGRWKKHTK